MSQYSLLKMLFISCRKSGNDPYVVGSSKTDPQVCATGRLAAPSRLVNVTLIDSTQTIVEPVQQRRNFVSFSSSSPLMYRFRNESTSLWQPVDGSALMMLMTLLTVGRALV